MKLPQLAIKNYQFVLILITMALYVGISSLMTMPRNEDPNPKFPFYTVIAVYPGTSPEDVEELVVDPLEEAIDQLDEINTITTKIEEGLAVIVVEAEFGVEIDEKYDEVLREVKSVEPSLPSDLYSLEVRKFEPNKLTKIQQLAMFSTERSFKELKNFGELLEKRLEKLDGVDKVDVLAYPEEAIKVNLDFQRMNSFNVSLSDITRQLVAQNMNIPAGDISAGSHSFSVKSSGSFQSVSEIQNVVIKSSGKEIVYLKNVANVAFDYDEDNWIGRYNGMRSIFLTVTQASGQNLVKTGENINKEIDYFTQSAPEDLQIETVFEQAPAVKSRINGFFMNLLQGVFLVGLVIFLFLGWRPSIIVMTVIPLSIIIGIGVLNTADYALQQISIAALVIALGLLVDNGIVVVENIQRFLKQGYSLKDAAIQGTSEVGYAIISSTVTTLLAFLPLVFLNSAAGEFLRSLPLTVIIVLIISLILSMTLTPMFAGRFLKSGKEVKPTRISRNTNRFMEKVYTPLLAGSLKRGWLVISIGVILLLGSVSLFPMIGVTFFPTADKPLLLVEIETPRGSSLERTDKAVRYVESVLDTVEYVSSYATNTGHGNPQIYYNRIGEDYKKYLGQVIINFESWEPETFYITLNNLRSTFSEYSDAKITFAELKNGPPLEAPIEIKIIGEEIDKLKYLSYQVENIVRDKEGTIDITNPIGLNKTDLDVVIDRDKASMAGIALPDIDQVIRSGIDGLTIDEVSFNQEEYDLIVKAEFENESIPELNKVYLANFQGDQVPLSQVATIKFLPAISEILHFNTDRSTSVTANLVNPDKAIEVTELIINDLDKMEFPEGYSYYIGGEYESQQESFGDLGLLLMIALLGIFAVLVLQFRSFSQPLIVFAAIPLAVSGSFIALFLTGWSFSFFGFVGFISLVGIVVNNSIILVDYTNQLIRSGMSKMEAIKVAGKTRFTPIVLTTITTILGLVPLTFTSSNLWSPMGWTIIGGMISSTLLTLFVIPVLYNWFTAESKVEV